MQVIRPEGSHNSVTCMTMEERRESVRLTFAHWEDEGLTVNDIKRQIRNNRRFMHEHYVKLKVLKQFLKDNNYTHPDMYHHPVVEAVREKVDKINGYISNLRAHNKNVLWFFDHLLPRTKM